MKSAQQWPERLDILGSQREPFLFLLDFEGQAPWIMPLREIDADRVRFDFHGVSNISGTRRDLPESFSFEPHHIAPERYRRAFDRVQHGLQRGDSFLTNLAFPTPVTTDLTLDQVFAATQARYRLLVRDRFVCFSPEIFVQIDPAGTISSNPMKGTAPVSLAGPQSLLDDPKERAEHATITDLIRNDLSRVARRVRVTDYRYVEVISGRDGGLYQTSTKISGQLGADWHERIGSIFRELLPAGSVSGAPKPKTLEIIRAAEGRSRGYYCGVAVLFDGERVDSGVLIRFLEQTDTGLRYWSGGGVTARSDWQAEYRELCEKIYLPLQQPVPG